MRDLTSHLDPSVPPGTSSSAGAPPPSGGLKQWLAALGNADPGTKGRILVVCFRNKLWIEWSVYAACHLVRMGYQPVLLYSRREVQEVYGDDAEFWLGAQQVPAFEFCDIDLLMSADLTSRPEYDDMAERLAPLVVAQDWRYEESDVQTNRRLLKEKERMRALLPEYAQACEHAISALRPVRAICPSGIIGWSCSFLAAARRSLVPSVFVETWVVRPGHMIWNLNKPAVDPDLENWLPAAAAWDSEKEQQVADLLAAREDGTTPSTGWLASFHAAQRTRRDTPLPDYIEAFLGRQGCHFLLGTNVVGDSAMLGRSTIFESQRRWVQDVCTFFRSHPDLNLIVRAHPDEALRRLWPVRMGDVAAEAAGDASNILVLHGTADVNTHTLARRVDVGLVWTSTLGVDMVIRRRPVLLAANAPFAALAVGISVPDRAQYFRQIRSLAEKRESPSDEMVEAAKKYQWITFRKKSLAVIGRELDSETYRMEPAGSCPDRELFFQILAGERGDKMQVL
jgi:hypothetical protein